MLVDFCSHQDFVIILQLSQNDVHNAHDATENGRRLLKSTQDSKYLGKSSDGKVWFTFKSAKVAEVFSGRSEDELIEVWFQYCRLVQGGKDRRSWSHRTVGAKDMKKREKEEWEADRWNEILKRHVARLRGEAITF